MLLGPKILLVSHVCLGFRTSRCFGAINIPESFICVAVLLSPFLLSIRVTVLLPGCFWAQDTLLSSSPICFRVRSPCCLKLVSVLLYLLLFFSLGTFGTQSSPCFPPVSVLVSLVDPLLSVLCFGCFGETTLVVSHLFLRPSLCLFSTCFDTSFFVAVVLSGCFRRTGCSSDAPCPLSVSVLVVLVVSISRPSFFLSFFSFFLSFFVSFSLSLSLALLLSRCLLGPLILLVCHLFPYVSSLFSPSCILVSLVLSKLYPSFPPHCYSSLRLLWAECFSLLVFLRISLLACLCVLWDETYYPLHSLTLSLLHVSLQAVSLSSLHYRASF